MSDQSQYGHTLFLSGFQPGDSAERLMRIHFSKKVSEGAPFLHDEAWIQDLIMRHPSLLSVDKIEPAFNTMVPICCELPVQSNFLDNLLITPAGDIVLVECKLWRNPQARREVVAQILDYAKDMSTWNYESLEKAISATKPLNGSDGKTPRRLYDLVSAEGEIDEVSFHDAVSRNLKRGRFLLLIVGDGIREGVEGMVEYLQQHAGFHFILAFVEIALFKAPGGYLAQPRVLARTTNIDRGVVTLVDGRVTISPPEKMGSATPYTPKRTTMTQERFFEELEKHCPNVSAGLNAFIESLGPYNVWPEPASESLILRWRPEDGKDWNIATISKNGNLWSDHLGQRAKNEDMLPFHKNYLDQVAALVPEAYVKKTPNETAWFVAVKDKYIKVDALVADQGRRDGWIAAIKTFQAAVMERSQDNG